MVAFFDSELPPYQYDWWVMDICRGTEADFLFVMCKVTQCSALVANPTPEELAAAEGPMALKYKLLDESRVFRISPPLISGNDDPAQSSPPGS